MGQGSSTIYEPHTRMYNNLLSIQSPATRVQMIQTMLSSPEHLAAIRAAGIYGHLLHYVQQVREGKPALLPGEKAQQPLHSQNKSQVLVKSSEQGKGPGNEKALNYFSACLRILGLEEEVALTNESLKAAYKKSVVRAHPDKGGSEKEFEAVTRAYAYLGEILLRINGGRSTSSNVEAPAAISSGRSNEADAWKMVEPVHLNPSKLNLDAFNTMYEKTRIPDPEESGYGDWLKGEDSSNVTKFSGKFNRDIFNREFESDQKQRGGNKVTNAIVAQELSLASRMGFATELGRTARDDYTVAANERGMGYTDLKKAYTEYNTFSHQTAGVKVDSRSLESVSKERKSAPTPLANSEMAALAEAEAAMLRREENRRLTMAQEAVSENNYFERMKRLVIRNS